MHYHELIERMADDTLYTKEEVRNFLKAFVRVTREALLAGRDVELQGLGRFVNVPAPACVMIDPNTKERVWLGPSRRVKFIPTRSLKQAVRASRDFYTKPTLETKFGLEEEKHGEVCSCDRPEEGGEGKEGTGGEQG